MKNLNGEYITEEKVKEISQRISDLSKESIDELFYRINFKIVKSERGKDYDRERKYLRIDNKALSPYMIDNIKEGDSGITETMLLETPLDIILPNLEELEGRDQ